MVLENKFSSTVIRVTFHENKYLSNIINMADKQEFTREFETGCYFIQQQDSYLHCKCTFHYDNQLKSSFYKCSSFNVRTQNGLKKFSFAVKN